ncbi:MAG: hypothetical protein JWM80_2213 [Cyanobacteria bacterium RYN_339]|nr:hypothetical protein [Cyanobacteria bacterium RYN_339]
MSDTITRDAFYRLMLEKCGPAAQGVVDQLLVQAGWQQKDAFTRDEVLTLMTGVPRYAREAIANTASPVAIDAATRVHVNALLDVLDDHVFPLMRQEATAS